MKLLIVRLFQGDKIATLLRSRNMRTTMTMIKKIALPSRMFSLILILAFVLPMSDCTAAHDDNGTIITEIVNIDTIDVVQHRYNHQRRVRYDQVRAVRNPNRQQKTRRQLDILDLIDGDDGGADGKDEDDSDEADVELLDGENDDVDGEKDDDDYDEDTEPSVSVSPSASLSPTGSPTITIPPTVSMTPTGVDDPKILKKSKKDSNSSSSSSKSSKSSSQRESKSSSEKESKSEKSSSKDGSEYPTLSPAPSGTIAPSFVTGKSEKDSKSQKDSSKSSKSQKESGKSSKNSSKGPSDPPASEGPTLPPAEPFVPKVVWRAAVSDAANTGEMFFDPTTEFGWYTYNAAVASVSFNGEESRTSSEARAIDNEIVDESVAVKEESKRVKSGGGTEGDTKQLDKEDDDAIGITYGKICAIDTSNGEIMTPCQEIRPVIRSSTSSEIQSISACYGDDGSIISFAVIVHDQTKFLQFTTVMGSRLVVYSVAANSRRQAPVDVVYDGWTSMYGEPSVSGRPTFSDDCGTVYSTWVTNKKFGGTIAVSTAISALDGSELWRTSVDEGDGGVLNRRFVGFGLSKDGNTLFSATNLPGGQLLVDDTSISTLARSMGIYALDASTGEIVQQYTYDDDGDHNAYVNLIVDQNDGTYHIDRAFGLIKFDGSNLSKGPVWKLTSSTLSIGPPQIPIRRLASVYEGIESNLGRNSRILTPKDDSSIEKQAIDDNDIDHVQPNNVFTPAAAYQPALDGSETSVFAYDSISTRRDETSQGGDVHALATDSGIPIWFSSMEGFPFFEATDDTVWAPSESARGGNGGVYTAAGPLVFCQDGEDGALLWRYEVNTDKVTGDTTPTVSKVTVMSNSSVLLAVSGVVEMLQTSLEDQPTPTPSSRAPSPTRAPNTEPTSPVPPPATRMPITAPTKSPTLAPISSSTYSSPHFSNSKCVSILVSIQLGLLLKLAIF